MLSSPIYGDALLAAEREQRIQCLAAAPASGEVG